MKNDTIKWTYYYYGNDDTIKSLRIPEEIIQIAAKIPA